VKTKLDNKAPPSTPVASGPAAPASAATEAAPILETKGSNDAFGGDAAPMAPDGNVPVVLPGAVDGIHTNFPVNDLGAIPASGRDPLGFRLDGDSLGGMRVTARRISNSDRAGFEIVGALAPSAAEMIGNRLKKAGGAAQPFQFSAADDQAGVLTHTGTPWSPGAQATRVEGDGFVVELVGKTPEALKGTLRIRVFGSDAEATKALAKARKAFGLDALFTPPAQKSERRLILERFIRVEQRFFTLPSDRTLANAVRDAARQAVESAAGPIAREVAKTAITHSADKAKSDALATAVTAAEAHVSVLMKDALRTSAAFGVNALLPPSGFNGDLDGALATALDAVKAKVEAESSSVEGKAKVEAHQALERLARDELEAHLSAALLAIAKAQLPGAGLDGIAATIASTAPQSLDVSAMTAAARRQATSAARAPIEHDLHAAAEWAAKIEASAKCKEAAEAAATAAAKTWAEEATTDSEHAASVAEQQASVDVGAVASDAIESTVAEIVEREASVVASVKAGMLAMAVAEDAMLKLPDTAAQIAAAAPAAAEQLVAACVAEDLGIDLEHATDAIVDSIVEKMLADGKLKAFEFGWGSDSVWNHSPSSVGGMGGLGSMMGASMPSEGPKDFSWWGACTGHEMHTKTAFGEGAYESHGSNYFPYHEKADLDSLVKSPPSDAQKAEFDAIFEALSPQPKSDLHALFPDGKVPGKKTSDDKQ